MDSIVLAICLVVPMATELSNIKTMPFFKKGDIRFATLFRLTISISLFLLSGVGTQLKSVSTPSNAVFGSVVAIRL